MRLLLAFCNAIAGIVYCVRTERHMKIHLLAATLALVLAWKFTITGLELAVLLLTIAAVLSAEMINTALEAIVDKVSPEFHPLAKAAKDAAAGAVLILSLSALGVGYILFFNKLLKLLR